MSAPSTRNRIRVDVSHPLGEAELPRLRRRAALFLRRLELRGVELSLSLVGDRGIRRLNRTWRDKDTATDVLSFPGGEPLPGQPGPRLLGDVVISIDTAKREARQRKLPLRRELDRYLAHGILHLLGHDHQEPEEARRMAEEERRLLGAAGMLEEEGTLTGEGDAS